MMRLQARCLAVLLLFFLALGGSDAPAMRQIGDTQAAAAAMRSMVAEMTKKISFPLVACVGLSDWKGPRDFPGGLLDDLIAANSGLHPVSACQFDMRNDSYSIPHRRQTAPLLYCVPPTFAEIDRSPRVGLAVTCGVHHAFHYGSVFEFEVYRGSIGAIEAFSKELSDLK